MFEHSGPWAWPLTGYAVQMSFFELFLEGLQLELLNLQ